MEREKLKAESECPKGPKRAERRRSRRADKRTIGRVLTCVDNVCALVRLFFGESGANKGETTWPTS
jgi:hypothetical protein